jgi:hypothetical protein
MINRFIYRFIYRVENTTRRICPTSMQLGKYNWVGSDINWWILFHYQGQLEKTVIWAESLSYSIIFRKLHWTWSGCIAIVLLLNPFLLLCAQLQDGSDFVIFQENKSLVADSLNSLRDNTVVSPDEEVVQFSPFLSSFLFFVCEREWTWDLSHRDHESLKLFHKVEKLHDNFLI